MKQREKASLNTEKVKNSAAVSLGKQGGGSTIKMTSENTKETKDMNNYTTKTYTARWTHNGKVIYTLQPHGNLFGLLPLGSLPYKFPGSPEDEWDGALFKRDGETICVLRDPISQVAATVLGKQGGLSKSEKKSAAARENGKLGGRKPKFSLL